LGNSKGQKGQWKPINKRGVETEYALGVGERTHSWVQIRGSRGSKNTVRNQKRKKRRMCKPGKKREHGENKTEVLKRKRK